MNYSRFLPPIHLVRFLHLTYHLNTHSKKMTEMTLYFYNGPNHMDNDCYPSNLYHLTLIFYLKPRIQNSKSLHNHVFYEHSSTHNHNVPGTIPSPYKYIIYRRLQLYPFLQVRL